MRATTLIVALAASLLLASCGAESDDPSDASIPSVPDTAPAESTATSEPPATDESREDQLVAITEQLVSLGYEDPEELAKQHQEDLDRANLNGDTVDRNDGALSDEELAGVRIIYQLKADAPINQDEARRPESEFDDTAIRALGEFQCALADTAESSDQFHRSIYEEFDASLSDAVMSDHAAAFMCADAREPHMQWLHENYGDEPPTSTTEPEETTEPVSTTAPAATPEPSLATAVENAEAAQRYRYEMEWEVVGERHRTMILRDLVAEVIATETDTHQPGDDPTHVSMIFDLAEETAYISMESLAAEHYVLWRSAPMDVFFSAMYGVQYSADQFMADFPPPEIGFLPSTNLADYEHLGDEVVDGVSVGHYRSDAEPGDLWADAGVPIPEPEANVQFQGQVDIWLTDDSEMIQATYTLEDEIFGGPVYIRLFLGDFDQPLGIQIPDDALDITEELQSGM